MNNSRKVFLRSIGILVLSVAMFIGTTFAWFTDNSISSGNIIKAGNLDLKMYWSDDLNSDIWYDVEDPEYNTIFNYDNWEPGYTDVRYIKIVNNGNLAFNYNLAITPVGEVGELAEVINVFYGTDKNGIQVNSIDDLNSLNSIGLLQGVLNGRSTANGTLLAQGQSSPLHNSGEEIITIAMNMITTAGNEYQEKSIGDGFKITALATQSAYEKDSFGSSYDSNATYPDIVSEGQVSSTVTTENGKVAEGGIELAGTGFSAVVPEGVELEKGVDRLTLTVTPLEESATNITTVNQEILIPVDVHVSGVSENNTTPIIVNLGAVMPKHLNMGNYTLYHVEDGENRTMTYVGLDDEFTAHNQFKYDPMTGELTLAMVSFSEVAILADEENAWNGKEAEKFSKGSGTESDPYIIANADELAYMGDRVSNDNANFGNKHYKLIADINIGGDKAKDLSGNPVIWYPIGYNKEGGKVATAALDEIYFEPINTAQPGDKDGDAVASIGENSWYTYGGAFEGVFDGNGHTISNIYQNTWAMKGNYDGHYYNAAMGLFGYVNGGTVKNLTINNFQSQGEFAPTGCVTAYADGTEEKPATFENISITNSHPQTYNTGVAGIVGWNNADGMFLNFKNITVDETNTISALWGSWDVAASGILGSLKNNSHATFNNCHIAATIDVYNDVCGNYQYYWYRYSGAFIGTVYRRINGNGALDLDYGVEANDCTVNFGRRHEYYYCEFEKNTQASYTEDYQFSRVSHSELNQVDGCDKTCHHTSCTHEHSAKEDKQAVYIPYKQLFGGYGWGVAGVDADTYKKININDISKSVTKFEKAETANEQYKTGTTVTIGELFWEKQDDNLPEIIDKNVQVYVSPDGSDSTASGKYTQNAADWTKGTLTFSGSGKAKVSITDYYFCLTTTIDVEITQTDKFDLKFENTDKYLYRVGNKNAVALGTLFEEKTEDLVKSENIIVEIITQRGNAAGNYTANTSAWEKGTIQFSGTGIVAVTIKGDNTTPLTLILEVIDATNVTKYSELKNYNVTSVLLADIDMGPNSALYLNGGATLYGNGFTFDCTNGAHTASGSISENYVIGLVDAHLDNVKIIGKVYTRYGAQASNDYNRALVVSKGNCSITNCYLSNTASPIRLVEGSLEVKGTTVKGGNFANIDVRNGHLVVEDVTTINQALGNDKADDGSDVIGLGIVVYYENVDVALTSVNIRGTLKQFNHISNTDKFSHEYATTFAKAMMESSYAKVVNGKTWVNSGIVSMTKVVPKDDRNDKAGYEGQDVSLMSKDGYAYTVKPTAESVGNKTAEYVSVGQGAIPPQYSFDFTNKNYIAKTDGSNDYCYYENGKVLIAMDQGETFAWDPFILSATKNGKTLDYTVSYGGKTYTEGQKIGFDASGEHVVTYTYTDSDNYGFDADGNLISIPVEYTKTVNISVSVIKPAAKHAAFTFGSSNTTTETLTVNNKTYVSAKDVAATDKQWGYITVNGTKIFYPIINAEFKKAALSSEYTVYYYVFNGAVSITDYKDGGTGGEQIYNASTTTMPLNLSVVNGMEAKYTDINSACVDISKLTKDGPSGEVWDFSASTTVSGTTKYNGYLAHQSPSGLAVKSGTRDYDAITVAQFSYIDEAGATYYYFVGYFMPNQVSNSGDSGGCVTPDTLITLTDGSQVRVDSLAGSEQLLVWNMEEGKLDSAPILFVDNDSDATYEVIKLYFSDGTEVKVISEHGFWDYDLNKYVYLDRYANKYIGHTFAKQNGDVLEKVELVDVVLEDQLTTAWSPVTAGHLCYFVNGMLSMPGGVGGLFNIFDVDAETMTYDYEAMVRDVETYGLFTYEELSQYAELSREMFDVAGGQYLKVSIGKGNLTEEELIAMIERYSKYFE